MIQQITDGDRIKIYRVDDDPVFLEPSQVVFTDRTRMEHNCKWKRYVEYEKEGMGFVSSYRNDHLALGAAVHEGIDLRLQGGTFEKALEVAEIEYLNFAPWPENMPQEQIEAIMGDGLNLVKAFVYAFDKLYLPIIMDEYEVLEVEEETNWLLLPDFDEDPTRGIVVMSRLDGVLRKKSSGRIWHMSHKTSGSKFDDKQLDKLKTDIQRFSEGYAIWAKYGEPPEGTLYNYFLKGGRYLDKDLGIERYTTGLVRPWLNRLAQTGTEITPEMLSFVYEWDELDPQSMTIKGRKLGKGWEKVDIYKEMDYLTYLDWLSEGIVARQGRNYLSESVSGLVPLEWRQDHAERWRIGAARQEAEWAWKTNVIKEYEGTATADHHIAQELPLNSSECFAYNSKCSIYSSCWKDRPLDNLIEEGHLVPRTPNHLVELRKIK